MEETKVHEIRVKKETARMEPLETLSRPDAQPTKAHPKPSPAPQQPPLAAAGSKRKRNLPGTPDPEAEVIALSPTTLMATNRFVCEICNKGFQRDQNLQLHRRGHNLPWKLRQRSSKEIRKRVYICPEPSCVHHDPSRALGDLTGIKKHFCRKHGEKKWKCDKCSKRYAVQSDWKAHSKTCGTREYRCDCGTLFSRRDSFITHRAFCDALAEDSARVSAAGKRIGSGSDMSSSDMVVQVIGPAAASTMSVIGGGGAAAAAPSSPHTNNLGAAAVRLQGIPNHALQEYDVPQAPRPLSSSGLLLPMVSSGSTTGSLFAHLFSSAGTSMPGFHATSAASMGMGISGFSDFTTGVNQTERSSATASLSLSSAAGLSSCSSSVYNDGVGNVPSMSMLFNQQQLQHHHTATAQMSATALLQKAAQMGATASNSSSMLRGFGFGGGDSSSMSLWQGQRQEPARVVSQGMGPSLLPVGLGGGGSTRAEDGSDRFTHDFLGVGGANGMAAAAGGMGRTLSQCDLASITSLGPGVDLGAFFTQRENLRSVGASGHSPGKSWDSS
ncbi:unnamed protein product [Sphagnum jensenii]|uniref:C2H2-type domain-containing protein n=1 Tax=Sphagnum jensenii TaxID=128206 RepID=A0ABP0X6I6_9BRYO